MGLGSSPHTRGAHRDSFHFALWVGIIPAYAGSTARSGSRSCRLRDHPRIRGEHFISWVLLAPFPGSSPHTRGALFIDQEGKTFLGIIPAYAGSTSNLRPLRFSDLDHPRIRGEHDRRSLRVSAMMGSSPHTRGARRSSMPPSSLTGIIPAYAGSTQKCLHA